MIQLSVPQLDMVQVFGALPQLFVKIETLTYICCDNGSAFMAKNLEVWLAKLTISATFIGPRGPWENGYCESFISRIRDGFWVVEAFDSLHETVILTRRWIDFLIKQRPRNALGY